MTNGWVDIKNADVILAMGGNPAENHPVGFKWFMEAKRNRNAKLVVVDPRFTRTAAVADLYSPIRAGTDIAYLSGIIRYAIENKRYHEDYVKTDPTLQDPQCVFQLLKKHVDRYTPEIVERVCGVPKQTFLKVAEAVTSTGTADRVGTVTYALGWTQHSTAVQMIRAAAMLQLLLGNVGRPGGGVNAFRGHSNIQGATDTAGTFEILPGYLATPTGSQATLADYLEKNTPTTLNKQAWATMNYWVNYPKFMVSLLKAVYGKAATRENEFGYSW